MPTPVDRTPTSSPVDGDAARARAVATWFESAARALPWRSSQREPYHALVSEFMLQQTQVSRVVEKFSPFLERFPTLADLAAAPIEDVYESWAGLGYYRRARLLHQAARAIVARHAGVMPRSAQELAALPGIGPYTAGALASIVFGVPAPIVDGNVVRVLTRWAAHEGDAEKSKAWAWDRASELVASGVGAGVPPGVLNEGLMELGAVVCTPRAPRCDGCPVQGSCRARELGIQERIPSPKVRVERRVIGWGAVIVQDARGRVLVERRAATGMFAGLLQAPTLETPGRRPSAARVAAWLKEAINSAEPKLAVALTKLGTFDFQTTHREIRAAVYLAQGNTGHIERTPGPDGGARTWLSEPELAKAALGNAQKRVFEVGGLTLHGFSRKPVANESQDA
ncbi:MAG: A/G-specific adenine glycosylase [Planctomycetota bacterium]|nr:A/G-specific adenine glycosylase [Planctomycetota bacterium]